MDTLSKDLSMARMRKLPIRVVEDRVQFISLIVLQRLQQAAGLGLLQAGNCLRPRTPLEVLRPNWHSRRARWLAFE